MAYTRFGLAKGLSYTEDWAARERSLMDQERMRQETISRQEARVRLDVEGTQAPHLENPGEQSLLQEYITPRLDELAQIYSTPSARSNMQLMMRSRQIKEEIRVNEFSERAGATNIELERFNNYIKNKKDVSQSYLDQQRELQSAAKRAELYRGFDGRPTTDITQSTGERVPYMFEPAARDLLGTIDDIASKFTISTMPTVEGRYIRTTWSIDEDAFELMASSNYSNPEFREAVDSYYEDLAPMTKSIYDGNGEAYQWFKDMMKTSIRTGSQLKGAASTSNQTPGRTYFPSDRLIPGTPVRHPAIIKLTDASGTDISSHDVFTTMNPASPNQPFSGISFEDKGIAQMPIKINQAIEWSADADHPDGFVKMNVTLTPEQAGAIWSGLTETAYNFGALNQPDTMKKYFDKWTVNSDNIETIVYVKAHGADPDYTDAYDLAYPNITNTTLKDKKEEPDKTTKPTKK